MAPMATNKYPPVGEAEAEAEAKSEEEMTSQDINGGSFASWASISMEGCTSVCICDESPLY